MDGRPSFMWHTISLASSVPRPSQLFNVTHRKLLSGCIITLKSWECLGPDEATIEKLGVPGAGRGYN